MYKFLVILLLVVLNFILCVRLRSWKPTIAGGIDLTLTGSFLAGYWLGFRWGIIFSIIFMFTFYITSFDMGIHSLVNILTCCLVGALGSLLAIAGVEIVKAALITIISYCLLSDIIAVFFLGERNFISLFFFDAGAILFNYYFFMVFF